MERRGFFAAGAALGVVGLSAVGRAQAATTVKAAATAKAGPSIFDFGAAGDGVTDDSAAFSKALLAAATTGQVVAVPGVTYAIARPITFVSSTNVGAPWGLQCAGATLLSKITTGEDVMSLTSNNTVRYFRLTGGMKIAGSGSDGNGLHIFAPGGSVWFYNATIDGLSVEGVGGHGLLFEGNVFESTVLNSYFQDCKKNGATFAQSKGGVCSAINLIGCFFNQNIGNGLSATNFDSPYGGTTDIRVYGGYCRDNQGYGFYYNNGTGGAAIDQVGFENNCRALSPGDQNGAHVYGLSRVTMRNCSGYNMYGGATYLLRGWFNGLTVLDSCSQDAGGAMAASGLSRLVQIDGSSTGNVLMRACSGGIALKSGTTCGWQAENCSGPTPTGTLSIRTTVASV
jgi:polygalacturonase